MHLRSRGMGGGVLKSTCMQKIKSRFLHINIKMTSNTIKKWTKALRSLFTKKRHMILKITVISKMKTNHNIIPLHTH